MARDVSDGEHEQGTERKSENDGDERVALNERGTEFYRHRTEHEAGREVPDRSKGTRRRTPESDRKAPAEGRRGGQKQTKEIDFGLGHFLAEFVGVDT